MRALLPLIVLTGCATHDVLRSERVAERAVCSRSNLGIFGYPFDTPACADDVVHLGDGCYVVREHATRSLVECAAEAPDGHVMCVRDPASDRPLLSPGPGPVAYAFTLDKHPFPASGTVGRCRGRYENWIAAHQPRQPSPAIRLSVWVSRSGKRVLGQIPAVTFVPEEDAAALERIVPFGAAVARVCPGPTVELTQPANLPVRFARPLRATVERAFAGVPLRWWDDFSFRLTPPENPPSPQEEYQ